MKAEERWEYYEYFEPEGGEDEISYSIDIEYLYTNNENETQLGYDGFSLSKYHKDTLELAEKYFQE